jgi:hypothetical protein
MSERSERLSSDLRSAASRPIGIDITRFARWGEASSPRPIDRSGQRPPRAVAMSRAVLVLAAVLALAGCSRPSAKDCEEALRNYVTLLFWEQAEKDIAAAPPEQRDALRKEKAALNEKQIKEGMELGVMQCRGARDHDGVKCMKAATTAAQARKCRAPKD